MPQAWIKSTLDSEWLLAVNPTPTEPNAVFTLAVSKENPPPEANTSSGINRTHVTASV
jgi:hypothetical protein